MKIYTRTGDKGQTSLFGGARVAKNNPRVDTYGILDELNSALGFALALIRQSDAKLSTETQWLLTVQRDLFAIGSWLASPEASARVEKGEEAFPGSRSGRTQIGLERIQEMEQQIDSWEARLPPMTSFILPGGQAAGAQLHCARTICRRAERAVVELRESGETVPEIALQYMNRLADALFVIARFVNKECGATEDPWI